MELLQLLTEGDLVEMVQPIQLQIRLSLTLVVAVVDQEILLLDQVVQAHLEVQVVVEKEVEAQMVELMELLEELTKVAVVVEDNILMVVQIQVLMVALV